jgi:hypothetical protein
MLAPTAAVTGGIEDLSLEPKVTVNGVVGVKIPAP